MKRKLTKILAALFAMVMLMSCVSLSAFASDGTTDPTPTNAATGEATATETGHTYQIYQIFTGTYDSTSGKVSQLYWGQNSTGTYGSAVEASVVTELTEAAANKNNSESDLRDLVLKYLKADSTYKRDGVKFGTSVAEAGSYEFSGIEPGYYLIRDKANSLDNTTGQAYTFYVIQSSGTTLTFKPKTDGGIPTVDKKTTTDADDYNNAKASTAGGAGIGDQVNFTLTASLPSTIGQYNTYYLSFKDTLSKGLTLTKDDLDKVKVYIKTSTVNAEKHNVVEVFDVTDWFYKGVEDGSDSTTILTVAVQDFLAFKNLSVAPISSKVTDDDNGTVEGDYDAHVPSIDKNTKVIVTYSATLNDDALVTGNDNDVALKYSNDPNNSGKASENPPEENPKTEPTPISGTPTGETAKSKVTTYTTGIVIEKTGKTKSATGDDITVALQGAEFTLTSDNAQTIRYSTGTTFAAKDGDIYSTADSSDEAEKMFFDTELTNPVYYKLNNGAYTTKNPLYQVDGSYVYDQTQYKQEDGAYKHYEKTEGTEAQIDVSTATYTVYNDAVSGNDTDATLKTAGEGVTVQNIYWKLKNDVYTTTNPKSEGADASQYYVNTDNTYTMYTRSTTYSLYTNSYEYTEDADGEFYKLTNGNYTTVDPATYKDIIDAADGISPDTEDAEAQAKLDAAKAAQAQYALYESTTQKYTNVKVTDHDGNALYWKLNNGSYTDVNPASITGDTSTYADTTKCYTIDEEPATEASGRTARAVTDDSGVLSFSGIGPGAYRLSEIVAPAGYTAISPMDFEIKYDAANSKWTVSEGLTGATVGDDGYIHITIQDSTQGSLPSTGGIGTTIFYVVGSALVLGAAILLITKKRMSGENV